MINILLIKSHNTNVNNDTTTTTTTTTIMIVTILTIGTIINNTIPVNGWPCLRVRPSVDLADARLRKDVHDILSRCMPGKKQQRDNNKLFCPHQVSGARTTLAWWAIANKEKSTTTATTTTSREPIGLPAHSATAGYLKLREGAGGCPPGQDVLSEVECAHVARSARRPRR